MTRLRGRPEIVYDVIYRGSTSKGTQAEFRLRRTFAAATLADAWERLSEIHGGIDPRTIEIELREPSRRRAGRAALGILAREVDQGRVGRGLPREAAAGIA
jgi:hypothetical protein